jgi:hypothetical protein
MVSSRVTGYAEAILKSELGDWIVSQLPTIRPLTPIRVRVLYEHRCEVAMNKMARLPFELSVTISLARLKPRRWAGIVKS